MYLLEFIHLSLCTYNDVYSGSHQQHYCSSASSLLHALICFLACYDCCCCSCCYSHSSSNISFPPQQPPEGSVSPVGNVVSVILQPCCAEPGASFWGNVKYSMKPVHNIMIQSVLVWTFKVCESLLLLHERNFKSLFCRVVN